VCVQRVKGAPPQAGAPPLVAEDPTKRSGTLRVTVRETRFKMPNVAVDKAKLFELLGQESVFA
jgi:hypothetical protein